MCIRDRAQGSDAAILGARAAYIGGCHGTACTISDQLYGVRAGGCLLYTSIADPDGYWLEIVPARK